VRPFWSNIRAELTKMPKIFFFDLWLRNYLLRDFRNINERLDKWGYFENIVWRELLFKYGLDDIKFWRTSQDNEIDFIVNDTLAYEAKFSEKQISENKYKLFKEKYPDIPLDFITFENILEQVIMK
jgi:predicted AAA+ superfamily ATPase